MQTPGLRRGLPRTRGYRDGPERGRARRTHRNASRKQDGPSCCNTTHQKPEIREEPIAAKNSSCALNDAFGSAT